MQRKWKRRWQRLTKVVMPPLAAGMLLINTYNLVYANPAGGQVTAGSAVITTSGAKTTINQTSNKAAINWQSFNIVKGETVNFVQPSANAVALNRVVGSNASGIYGTLNANGKVFLINPNGILFAPGSQVNVGGLVASSLNMTDKDFMNGSYTFSGSGTGSVINQGAIQAGQAVLIGPQVNNEGIIAATVTGLAVGNQVSLDFNGDKLLNLTVDTGAAGGSAVNSGTILADGGMVVMSAGTKSALLNTVVNNSGMIWAQSVKSENGVIKLEGSTVTNSGTLDASGKTAGQTGGTVKVLGDTVTLAQGSSIDVAGDRGGGTALIGGAYQGGSEYVATKTTVEKGTSINADALTSGNGGQVGVWAQDTTAFAGSISATGGSASGNGGSVETSGHHTLTVADTATVNTAAVTGKTGNWLLDPADFVVDDTGTKGMTATALSNALNNSSITITTTSGTATATKTTDNTSVGGNNDISNNGDITINSAVSWDAANNLLTLNAYRNININAAITASGDNAGLALTCGTGTTGAYSLGKGAKITLAGSGAQFSLNNTPYEVINSHSTGGALAALQAINQNLSGKYCLGVDIDASATSDLSYNNGAGFIPIGVFNGGTHSFQGNFDGLGHTINSLNIKGKSSPGYWHSAGLFAVTDSSAVIRNTGLVNSSVEAILTDSYLIRACTGGLVGDNYGGEITNCYSTGKVTVLSTANQSIYDDTITTTWAGGLVGRNRDGGKITGCYSTSDVTVSSTATTKEANWNSISSAEIYAGGLVGQNQDGEITNCYSTGDMSLTANGVIKGDRENLNARATVVAGGLVGESYGGRIMNCYSIGDVTVNASSTANSSKSCAADTQVCAGGLVGVSQEILDCYSTGDVIVSGIAATPAGFPWDYCDSWVHAGGLVGSSGKIVNCYSTGNVAANAAIDSAGIEANASLYAGGLVGKNWGTITDCYWNTTNNSPAMNGVGTGTDHGATGLSTAQMQAVSSYDDSWGIANTGGSTAVWRMYEGYTYPLLRSFLKPLTVTVNNDTVTYNGSARYATISTSEAANGQLLGALSYTNNATGETGNAVNAGTYTVSGSGLYAGQQGYDISYGGDGMLTIVPADLTVAAVAQSKTYGTDDPVLIYSVTGLKGNDTVSDVLSGNLTREEGETVAGGPYAITRGTLAANGNYMLNYTGSLLTINPATLTVAANDASRYFGNANPAFTYTVTGLANGDKLSDVIGNFALTTPAIRLSGIGSYVITPGGTLLSTNYIPNFISGTLTVNQAPWQYGSYQGAAGYIYRLLDQSGLPVGSREPISTYQASPLSGVPGLTVVEPGINLDGLG